MDPFENNIHKLGDPARKTYVVVPHAADELPILPQYLRFNTAGNITYRTVDADADVTETFAAGDMLYARVKWVRAAPANTIAYA